MSHVTQGQAQKLFDLDLKIKTEMWWHEGRLESDYGEFSFLEEYGDRRAPSAEELMEWLPANDPRGCGNEIVITKHEYGWKVGWATFDRNDPGWGKSFGAKRLIDALYSCACWVLEGKK